MSDTSLNKVVQYGTAAERTAFTPAPAAGSKVLYLWYETDNAPDVYAWDGNSWELINASVAGGITQLTGDVTAGPGSGSQAATLANNSVVTAKILDANVTYAKIQDVSAASKLLGRGDSGAGDVQEITLDASLTMTGTTLAASGGGSSDWTAVITKGSDETVTNSSTLQDDDFLIFGVVAGRSYLIELLIKYIGNDNTFDLFWDVACSVGTMAGLVSHININQTDSLQEVHETLTASSSFSDRVAGLETTRNRFFKITCTLTFSATGNFSFRWACTTATAGKSVTVKQGSILRYLDLG